MHDAVTTTMRTVQSASSSTNALARKFGSIELRLLVTSFVGVLFVINMMVVGSHEKLLHEHFPNEARQGRKLQALSTSYRVEPKLVWLMSFPNSGTSFTSRLVRDATKTDSASNYADETISGQEGLILPVYKDQPMGPFWIKPAESPEFTEPANYVLTKTHCGMRCTLCPPDKYGESSYSFRRRCLTTKWMEVQEDGSMKRTFSEYKPDRLAKAVHLIRDPFDNIVSRYHLEQQITGRTAKTFEKSREGFRAYCASVESLHASSEKKVAFLDKEILRLMSKVPCHEDFLRYIEWHNLAFITAADLELETYVLHYEWFTTRYNATATELLDFLELEQQAEPTPFEPGLSYNYYNADEKAALKEAFQIMASPQTWSHVALYFEQSDSAASSLQ